MLAMQTLLMLEPLYQPQLLVFVEHLLCVRGGLDVRLCSQPRLPPDPGGT
jgi:hypothetical protein